MKNGGAVSEWDTVLKYLLFAYMKHSHNVIGVLPADLLFGRHMKGPHDLRILSDPQHHLLQYL